MESQRSKKMFSTYTAKYIKLIFDSWFFEVPVNE